MNQLNQEKKKIQRENIIEDFFKTVDSTKEDIETQFEKNKTKLYDNIPLLKELEDKMNERSKEVKSTIKETINKAKNNFNNNSSDENVASENKKKLQMQKMQKQLAKRQNNLNIISLNKKSTSFEVLFLCVINQFMKTIQ